MKLNAVRDFQTGIYDYNVMTSTFLRVAPGWPLAKVSFSSQEWCGHVWHQLVPRAGRLAGLFHSYFDGEADGADALEMPADGVLEDALPILVRGWNGASLAPGPEPRGRSCRRSSRRESSTGRSPGRGRRSRAPPARASRCPRALRGERLRCRTVDGRKLKFAVEAAPPFRLVRQTGADGEELPLEGSTRLSYWQLNKPGDEKHLKELGLR